MTEQDLHNLFPIKLPIELAGDWWNGKPDEYSNLPLRLNYTQKFGITPYSKTGVYGSLKGHNGHDIAGNEVSPLVFPCKAWVSHVGWDERGYGHFIFFETEAITRNGETVKMEYVIAHMRAKPIAKPCKWYSEGDYIGEMGTTGMSTGVHTHFGGRPLIRQSDGSWKRLFGYNGYLGYIDLEPMMTVKPVYNKQDLINLDKFMANIDGKLVFNNKTGEIGYFYDKKLRTARDDRFIKMLASYLVRKDGANISDEEWNKLEKTNF